MANIKYTAQCIKFIKKTNRFTYLLHSDHWHVWTTAVTTFRVVRSRIQI